MRRTGTISRGIRAPIIRAGDDIAAIVSSIISLLFVYILSQIKKKRYYFNIFYISFGLIITHLFGSSPVDSVYTYLSSERIL